MVLIPHIDQDLIGYTVEVEDFQLTYPKDRVQYVDLVTITFVSIDVAKIRDYDNMLFAQPGAVCVSGAVPNDIIITMDEAIYN